MRNAILLVISALILWLPAQGRALEVDPDYPGLVTGSDGVFLLHAQRILEIGVKAYAARFDRYPNTWQQVCEAGYCQLGDVMAPDGSMTDLNDGNIDFVWDVAYYYDPLVKRGGRRIWMEFGTAAELNSGEYALLPGISIRERFETQKETAASQNFFGWHEIENLELFFDRNAVYELVRDSIVYFSDIHGRYPQDLDELFSSDLCPLGRDPVNPVTGIRFSESTGDKLEYVRGDSGYWLYYLDEEGNRTSMLSMPVFEGGVLR